MKSAGKARSNGLYRHIRTSKEIIRNLLNDYTKIGKIFPFSLFTSSIIYQNLHSLYEIPFSGFLYTFCFCITLYTYFAYFHSLKSFSLVQNACFSNILEKP